MKKIRLIAIAMLLVVAAVFSGCGETTKTYSGKGLSITMPAGLAEEDASSLGYTYCLSARDYAVFALEESKEELASYGFENLTVDEYFEIVKEGNGVDAELVKENGLNYFTYEDATGSYFYLAAICENDASFWLCQFSCTPSDRSKYESKFKEWAASIEI